MGKGVICCFSKVQQITTSAGGFSPCCPWSSAVSSQLAEAPSPRQGGRTSAVYEATTRQGSWLGGRLFRVFILAVSRSPTFGLCSSYAIGPERHVIAEGYMTRKLNFCLEPTLTLTLRPSRRVS